MAWLPGFSPSWLMGLVVRPPARRVPPTRCPGHGELNVGDGSYQLVSVHRHGAGSEVMAVMVILLTAEVMLVTMVIM